MELGERGHGRACLGPPVIDMEMRIRGTAEHGTRETSKARTNVGWTLLLLNRKPCPQNRTQGFTLDGPRHLFYLFWFVVTQHSCRSSKDPLFQRHFSWVTFL